MEQGQNQTVQGRKVQDALGGVLRPSHKVPLWAEGPQSSGCRRPSGASKDFDSIAEDLYRALRRSDLVATEVSSSEGWLVAQPRMGQAMSPDRQAQELYRIADKNIAEYRQHYFGIMAGVERTEAQVAVFTTTLDTLRMKMLGYRLVGKDTESPTQDFLAAITEARMQLESIDKALEELDLTAFPKTISIMPDETNSPGLRENLLHSGPPPMPEGALKQFEPASEIDQEQNSP